VQTQTRSQDVVRLARSLAVINSIMLPRLALILCQHVYHISARRDHPLGCQCSSFIEVCWQIRLRYYRPPMWASQYVQQHLSVCVYVRNAHISQSQLT